MSGDIKDVFKGISVNKKILFLALLCASFSGANLSAHDGCKHGCDHHHEEHDTSAKIWSNAAAQAAWNHSRKEVLPHAWTEGVLQPDTGVAPTTRPPRVNRTALKRFLEAQHLEKLRKNAEYWSKLKEEMDARYYRYQIETQDLEPMRQHYQELWQEREEEGNMEWPNDYLEPMEKPTNSTYCPPAQPPRNIVKKMEPKPVASASAVNARPTGAMAGCVPVGMRTRGLFNKSSSGKMKNICKTPGCRDNHKHQ